MLSGALADGFVSVTLTVNVAVPVVPVLS